MAGSHKIKTDLMVSLLPGIAYNEGKDGANLLIAIEQDRSDSVSIHHYNPYRRSHEEWEDLHDREADGKLRSVAGFITEAETTPGSGNGPYEAHLHYTYKIDEKTFEDEAIFRCADRSEAFEIAKHYKRGSSVLVFYQPNNPRATIIGPHVPATNTLVVVSIIALIFVILFAIVFLVGVLSNLV
jgi:flagellar basal body rod protein FlgC